MSSLFATLAASQDAMGVLERALEVTQNNVNNANVPGYARQSLAIAARPFSPENGLPGGVSAGAVESARNQYVDAEVRWKLGGLGSAEQLEEGLSRIAALFDATGETGIPAALSSLLQNFSQWSADPNGQTARQGVLNSAGELSRSFQRTATALEAERTSAGQQLDDAVGSINDLAAKIRGYNADAVRSGPDAGRDANLQTALEQLSELLGITATTEADGTVTVLLGGQTPLVIGTSQYALGTSEAAADPAAPYPGAVPSIKITDAEGRDVTGQITGGRLAGLLQIRNDILPSLIGDPQQAGDLNELAAAVADKVNQLLSGGLVTGGPPPQSGQPLFVYDTTNPADAARSLALSDQVTPDKLAAIDPGPPYVANGIALKLAKLDGDGFVEEYGRIAAGIGRQLQTASTNQSAATNSVAQARSLRDQISGVSLDEEAVYLLQFQRSYQAIAKMITVLDELTQSTLQMLG